MLNVFKQTCYNRHFELNAAKAIKDKLIKIPVYLSLGTEHIPPVLHKINKDFTIFPQHRCHSYFLSFGGNPESLAKELLGRSDGCNKGMGGSASVSLKPNIFGHSGLLGDQVPMSVGFSYASGKKTVVVIGDAALEECYVLSSLGFAASKKIPILFLVEDNDLSILTPKKVRRTWNAVDVAKGFGLPAIEISDSPETIYRTIKDCKLPALVNINVCRHCWHVGSGSDGTPEWNTFETFKKTFGEQGEKIENACKREMDELWNNLFNPKTFY